MSQSSSIRSNVKCDRSCSSISNSSHRCLQGSRFTYNGKQGPTGPQGTQGLPGIDGSTGPTGPPGSGIVDSGITPENQNFMVALQVNSILFDDPITSTPVILLNLMDDSSTFDERYISHTLSNVDINGFSVTTNLVSSIKTPIGDNTSTFSNVFLLFNGCPAIFQKSGTTVVMLANSAQDGGGIWNSSTVATGVAVATTIDFGHINSIGNPCVFTHINGDGIIRYHRSSSPLGHSASWSFTNALTPSVTQTIPYARFIQLVNGYPAAAIALYDSATSEYMIGFLRSTAFDGSAWDLVDNITTPDVAFVFDSGLTSTGYPTMLYGFQGFGIFFTSSTSPNGDSGSWFATNQLVFSSPINFDSGIVFTLSNGLPALMFKLVATAGIEYYTNNLPDASGIWSGQTILASIPYFASPDHETMYGFALPNGNVGLLYTNGTEFLFAQTSPTDPTGWQSYVVDDEIINNGFSPSSVTLNNGYIACIYASLAPGDEQIFYARSVLLNDVVIFGSSDFNINWVAFPT